MKFNSNEVEPVSSSGLVNIPFEIQILCYVQKQRLINSKQVPNFQKTCSSLTQLTSMTY